MPIDKTNILNNKIWLLFSMYRSLKKYPKISGYLDRISKIWIMKKIDIQSIQVSMYPKKTDIHVSKYPCIHVSMISKYPLIQLSNYPKKIGIQDIQVSGYQKKVVSVHPYPWPEFSILYIVRYVPKLWKAWAGWRYQKF